MEARTWLCAATSAGSWPVGDSEEVRPMLLATAGANAAPAPLDVDGTRA
jgi:hypothetical protein